MNELYFFNFNSFWYYYDIAENKCLKLIKSYLGPSRVFTDIEMGIEYLRNILEQVKKDIEVTILSMNHITAIRQIYSIFDITFRHYMNEKKERTDIDSLRIRDEHIINTTFQVFA